MITITDKVGDSGTVTVNDAWDVADAIRPWYPEAPAEVLKAVDDLQDALVKHDDQRVYGLESYLGVEIS